MRDDLDQRDGVNRRTSGLSTPMMAAIGAALVLAVLFLWAPWSGPRVADNSAPGTTVGSNVRPVAPAAPTTPAPAAPAPSTTR